MSQHANDSSRPADQPAEQTRQELPHVDNFEVLVEQHDEGWAVLTQADGQRSHIKDFGDEKDARFYADQLQATATRHEDAANIRDVPDSYPGKGVDERR